MTDSRRGSGRPIVELGPEAHYVTDSGPLLCLGAFPLLLRIMKARAHGKTHWVRAVREEISRQAAETTSARGAAARTYDGRGAAWLTPIVEFGPSDEADLAPVKDRLAMLAATKAAKNAKRYGKPAQEKHPLADLGEAQSIVHAKRSGHTLLCHDMAANTVAREQGIPSATVVDLAQQLVAEGQRPRQLADGLMLLQRMGIDTGRDVSGPLDLVPRPPRR